MALVTLIVAVATGSWFVREL